MSKLKWKFGFWVVFAYLTEFDVVILMEIGNTLDWVRPKISVIVAMNTNTIDTFCLSKTMVIGIALIV